MRRNGKLVTSNVVGPSQPSLHHMWNIPSKELSKTCNEEERKNGDKGIEKYEGFSENLSEDVAISAEVTVSSEELGRIKASKRAPLLDNVKFEKPPRRAPRTKNEKKPAPTSLRSQVRLHPIFGKRNEPGTSSSSILGAGELSSTESSITTKRLTRTTSVPHTSQRDSVLDEINNGPLSQPLPLSSFKLAEIEGKEAPANLQGLRSGSRDEPIVVEASPEREVISNSSPRLSSSTKSNRLSSDQKPGSFFAARKPNLVKTALGPRRKVGEGDLAPWPNASSLHVHDLFKAFQTTLLELKRIPARSFPETPTPPCEIPKHLLSSRLPSATSLVATVEPVGNHPNDHLKRESTLRECAAHPAIERFLNADYDITGTSWNERWRPQRASEVVGNETSSQYLRDWLLALEIKVDVTKVQTSLGPCTGINNLKKDTKKISVTTGLKRPKVIREVDRPRKRRKAGSDDESLDGWIASDDDGEEEESFSHHTFFADEDDASSYQSDPGSPWKPKLTRLSRSRPPNSKDPESSHKQTLAPPTPVYDFSDRLTNTILLSGPSGSGKSASVYACAEELGWEIFEVYPGIGKRNGTSILSLVGDVGKNHIVNRGSRTMPTSLGLKAGKTEDIKRLKQQGLLSCFSVKTNSPERVSPMKGGFQPAHDVTCSVSNLLDQEVPPSRQSIILLEEVDILYNEDTNFWPTVITLIKESRRPVIMTCNDPSLIPSNLLPLQTILTFNPCPEDIAVTYLKCLSLTEGYTVTDKSLQDVYRGEPMFDAQDVSDNLIRSNSIFSPYVPDLRRAINQLQFLCQGDPGFSCLEHITKKTESGLCVSIPHNIEDDFLVPDKPSSWIWSTPNYRESDTNAKPEELVHFHRLCLISDTLSRTDSDLCRSPSDFLNMYVSDESCPSDEELGHKKLDCRTEDFHPQKGGTSYNDYEEQIENEIINCVGRIIRSDGLLAVESELDHQIRAGEQGVMSRVLCGNQLQHFALVSNVLGSILPIVAKESTEVLVLDYEPWSRSIDKSDGIMEAATISEYHTKVAPRGGRTTRNSQRVQYERYFCLDEEQRREWQGSGLKVTDDL